MYTYFAHVCVSVNVFSYNCICTVTVHIRIFRLQTQTSDSDMHRLQPAHSLAHAAASVLYEVYRFLLKRAEAQ